MSYDPSLSRELARILWRQSVLARGGVSWLTLKTRALRGKEKALGPHLEAEFSEAEPSEVR